MNTIERLNRHASSRGFFAKVARLSGLSRDTVVRIATGITPNPGIKTLSAIDKGLDLYEAAMPSDDDSPPASPASASDAIQVQQGAA
jgi:DNA-binding phage protein